ncbi:MAG: 3-oxoacyl-[acyl-carrier-protein] synthase III C-terminal domain-containing protein [Bacteroidota bacterium]
MEWRSKIESIGVKLPQKKMSTSELLARIKTPCIKKFGLLTGIQERKVCSAGEDSFSLAVDAAEECLSFSRYEAGEIDMIINCSITKYKDGLSHHYEPSFSALIRDNLGAGKAMTFDISNACAGMLTGVYIADNFIRQGTIKNCLIVSGEYISNICDHAVKRIKTSLGAELSSLTLGDCGAAVIIDRTGDEKCALSVSGFRTFSEYSNLCIGRQNRNSPGGKMKTNARRIHQAAICESVSVVKDALSMNHMSFKDIDWLIPHQTSRSSILSGANRYLEYFGEQPAHVLINLKETGNTASTTHFLALYRYLNEKRFTEGENIMLLCFASGLIIGAVLFKMNDIVFRYGNIN